MNIRVLIFLGIFMSISCVHATHIRGGEVMLELVSCNSLTIRATIILYRDTGSPDDIQVGGGILYFGDGNEITLPEGGFSSTYLGNEVERNIFVVEHTYSKYGSYTVSYLEQNRNEGIINMGSSVTTPFYTNSSIIIDPFIACVSSTPYFLSSPVFEGSLNDLVEYSFAAISTDDNKLRYSLTIPKQDMGVNVGGYYVPDGVRIDSISGLFTWDTSNGIAMEGEYSFAVKVSQFREIDGVYHQLGHTIRDVQLILHNTNSTLNLNDDLNGSNINGILLKSGEEMKMTITLTDNNSNDNYIEVRSELSEPNLTFETISNSSTESKLIVTILSDENIERDNPYIISVRATSLHNIGPVYSKDRNYVIYTKNVAEPNLITSTSDRQLLKNRYVYPVPASQYVYLSNEKQGEVVSVYTLQGKLIKEETVEALKRVWVGDLSEGNYLLLTNDKIAYRVVIDN